MPSAALTLAAQTNGRQSKGPVTIAGKQKSAANIRKHGLFSKEFRTDAECDRLFGQLRASFSEELQPGDQFERLQVEAMAFAEARTWWAIRAYTSLITRAMESSDNRPHTAHQDNLAAVDRLMRYHSRFRHDYFNAWEDLQKNKK